MSANGSLGALVQSFFLDHLICVKGLRPASVRSYRDTVRLFLGFVAADKGCRITALGLDDLSFERVLAFLKHLEADRGNHIATRNQRLAALHCLFEYVATRSPEHLGVCQRVAAIPRKRVAPPETHFLEKDEVETLLRGLPRAGRHALRDRALVLFLYNTGARVSEVAELRVGHLELGAHPMVRLHGKGDKWRTCPLWQQTAGLLRDLLESAFGFPASHDKAVFSANGRPLTRAPPRRMAGRPPTRPAGQPAHLPPHGRRPPARVRGGGQRDPRLAGTCRPRHHKPLRRDQHQDQAGRPGGHPAAGFFGGIPHHTGLALRRDAAQVAGISLSVMCPALVASSRSPPGDAGGCRRAASRAHNAGGNRSSTT